MALRRMKAEHMRVCAAQAEVCGRGLDEAQLRILKAQVRMNEAASYTPDAFGPVRLVIVHSQLLPIGSLK